jgi:hypothetical protein
VKRTLLIVALVASFATWLYARPFSVPCPYDGQAMYFTGRMQSIGYNQESCEYGHNAQVRDADGRGYHQVLHSTWIACDSN